MTTSERHMVSHYTRRRICSPDYETVAKVPEDGIQLDAGREPDVATWRMLKDNTFRLRKDRDYDGVCLACVDRYWRMHS